jgi:hypothetical protein
METLNIVELYVNSSAQGKANIRQLQLALTWNRSDVAEDKLFGQENVWPEGKLKGSIFVCSPYIFRFRLNNFCCNVAKSVTGWLPRSSLHDIVSK